MVRRFIVATPFGLGPLELRGTWFPGHASRRKQVGLFGPGAGGLLEPVRALRALLVANARPAIAAASKVLYAVRRFIATPFIPASRNRICQVHFLARA